MARVLDHPEAIDADLRYRNTHRPPPPALWSGRYVPPPGKYAQDVIVYGSLPKGEKMGTMGGKPLQQYLQEGTGQNGQDAVIFTRDGKLADMERFLQQMPRDPHQFRLSISPKDSQPFFALQPYAEALMARIEKDVGHRLNWIGVVHRNTDRPHLHIIISGHTAPQRDPAQLETRLAVLEAERTEAQAGGHSGHEFTKEIAQIQQELAGKPLYINNDYLSTGIRYRASQIATWLLGPDRSKTRTQAVQQTPELSETQQRLWNYLQARGLAGKTFTARAVFPDNRPQDHADRQGLRHLVAAGKLEQSAHSPETYRFSPDALRLTLENRLQKLSVQIGEADAAGDATAGLIARRDALQRQLSLNHKAEQHRGQEMGL